MNFYANKADHYPSAQVTDAVHAKGSFMYLQLWALGRTAQPDEIKKENPLNDFTAASTIPLTGASVSPRPMTTAEIKEFVQLHATAACIKLVSMGSKFMVLMDTSSTSSFRTCPTIALMSMADQLRTGRDSL